jgi:hypothetical protein
VRMGGGWNWLRVMSSGKVTNLRVLLPEAPRLPTADSTICFGESSQWPGVDVLACSATAQIDTNRSVGVWVVLH